MTFDACDGSDENHYWDHHNGFTDTHVTGLYAQHIVTQYIIGHPYRVCASFTVRK